MSTVVLGYPSLNESDFEWIQSLRKKYDRQYGVVLPHFTFVFPTEKLSAEEIIQHVQSKSETQPKIIIRLTSAIVVEDDSKTFFHTFLVPTLGKQEIIMLHDQLYTDNLAGELRSDIPFIPHIGIGSNASKETMQELADKINSAGLNIEGFVDALTVASFDGKKVNDIKQVSLD